MISALLVGNHLSASGRNPTVSEELAFCFRQTGMRVLTTSSRPNKVGRLADMLATTLARRRSYEVAQIDLYSGPAFRWAQAVAALLTTIEKPFVISLHGGNLPHYAKRHPRRVGRLLRAAHSVTAPSGYLARELRSLRPDIEVVPNPLATDRYRTPKHDVADCLIVWVRAFHRIYDPITAIAAFKQVHDRYPAAKLAMYGPDLGDGSLDECRTLAACLGLEHGVSFCGATAKSEIPRILGRSSIFLNTSRIDNAPVSIVEAMAAGLPVVSSDSGGIPDLLEHGREGLLVPAGNTSLLGDAVCQVISSPTLASELSARGRTRTHQSDWRRVLPRWMSILREAAEHPNEP